MTGRMSEGIGEQQVIYLDKLTTHFCLANNSCPTFCGGVINGRIIREQSSSFLPHLPCIRTTQFRNTCALKFVFSRPSIRNILYQNVFCRGVINGRIIREQSSRSILFCSFVLRQVSLSIPYKMIILYPWNDQIPHNIPTCQHAVDHWSTLPSLTPPFMSQSRGRPFWIT